MLVKLNDGRELEINAGLNVFYGFENGPNKFIEWESLSQTDQQKFNAIESQLKGTIEAVTLG